MDSGTFDYFTEVIVGKAKQSRGDYTSSEDDNVLVQGIAGDELALGYFGLAYYEQNKDRLKVVPVDDGKPDNGDGPIAPSQESVRGGTYRPLSRPLFIYVSTKAFARPEVKAFVDFFMEKGHGLVEGGRLRAAQRARAAARTRPVQSRDQRDDVYAGAKPGQSLESLLAQPAQP